MKYSAFLLIALLPACCMRKESDRPSKQSRQPADMAMQEPMEAPEMPSKDMAMDQAMDDEMMNEQDMGDAMDIQIDE